jgi:ABC-type nitrate/sulfonate/bicarbonate transport system substrate-binding protein
MKSPRPQAALAHKAALAAVASVAIAGCGEVKNTITPQPGSANIVTVALAGQPNAFYIGLYEARALGLFKQTDMDVKIVIPTAEQDPVTMVHNSQVLVGISSEPNVLLHRNINEPVVGVAAIVHGPLSGISVTVPSGPSGGAGIGTGTGTTTTGTTTTATTATTGKTKTTRTKTVPSGVIMTATSPTPTSNTQTSTTQTSTTPTSTTVTEPDATTWPAKLQQLLSTPGYPTYDGLVVVVRKGSIVAHAPLIRRFVQALARGYRAARANPTQAITNLITEVPSLAPQKAFETAELTAALPYFFPTGGKVWGWQREAQWNSFGFWMTDHQLLSNPNASTDASTNELLPAQGV